MKKCVLKSLTLERDVIVGEPQALPADAVLRQRIVTRRLHKI